MRCEPVDLAGFEARLAARPPVMRDGWLCEPVRLAPGERAALTRLCAAHGIEVRDPIDRQLAELARIRAPAGTPAQHAAWARAYVGGCGGSEAVGAWMFVPWEARLVHVLAEEHYLEVVTDRNRDKITAQEQRLLRAKRIGVMGLSVGGEAAVTVAREHLCGAIVLADFDALDLSNLNRLAAGIGDLGENKARIVARRIALLDPWLDITVHEDGVTTENVEAFLAGLDLIVEECDDLRMKFRIRELACAHGIDMVFAADERGMLSIEPYSRMPDAAPFHGRIADPPRARSEYPDLSTFMAALVEWLGGPDALSARSRASLAKLGTELSGYPQLAGEATLAAAQVATVARRLLLGEPLAARLLNVDLDAIVSGMAPAPGDA